jgi:23S rRNA (adenine2030-N6)-methyltransferase
MLSYQHIYHAGNLADVQKHAVLAWILAYMTRKDKPISYIETHSGRAVYDLTATEALKTGEAAQGIQRPYIAEWFDADHPYAKALHKVASDHSANHYPGSPKIAETLLRELDQLHLAELHPQEAHALEIAIGRTAKVYQQDGFGLAQSLCPPTPRRGVLLIDPSYEIKSDYDTIPTFMTQISKKWNVGTIVLWYPVLIDGGYSQMVHKLKRAFPDGIDHRVGFPPARQGHRMIGSGLFIVNAPYGLHDELARLSKCFARLTKKD